MSSQPATPNRPTAPHQSGLSSQPGALSIRKVAVCGAGVMGAQIAAHCMNAGVPVVLFDLATQPPAAAPGATSGTAPASKSDRAASATQPPAAVDKDAIVHKALKQLQKLKPAPLAESALAGLIQPANYDDDLGLLADCDLVIEAIAERLDWKRDLYHRLAPALNPRALIASNTSGLSITALSEALPDTLRHRFCGVHFFNPPRYMPLVEVIPTASTDTALLDPLETFLTTRLGKGVVRAKDTPNFIGNRIGVFGILSIFHHTAAFGLPYELVDDLTGKRLGRAKSGTYRTADVVGLDTLAHVIRTMQEQLPDDPFHEHFTVPADLAGLIDQGALGQKTRVGYFRKKGGTILRLDPRSGDYVPATEHAADEVQAILKERDPAKRLQALHDSNHPQAQFLWAVLRDGFHYSAVHLADIAASARQVDEAMRWGFGHQHGPFEIWQAAGWQRVAGWIQDDIRAGKTLSAAPLPEWATQGVVWDNQAVHTPAGSFSPATGGYLPRSTLAVYQRQLGAPRLVGETPSLVFEPAGGGAGGSDADAPMAGALAVAASTLARVVEETDAFRLWTLPAPHPQNVLILSFKTKMHTLNADVVQGVQHAVDLAEHTYGALVIGQLADPFSAGADLKAMLPAFLAGGAKALEPMERALQAMVLRLRYAQVPVVAALAGLALGGGCELAVHCARRVAHLETYIGLVEAGIGIIPGAGGTTYCARRAAELRAATAPEAPLLAYLKRFVQNLSMAKVSGSALEARAMGYLRDEDPIVLNRNELLYVAVREAAQLAAQGWHPPLPQTFAVAGRDGIATLKAQLVNLRVGGYITDYDAIVGEHLAHILCGGDVDPDSLVDEAWMHALEREAFLALIAQPKTQERITSVLQTGKPVRN